MRLPASRSATASIAALTLALVFSSCGFGLSKRGAAPLPSATIDVSYGQGLDLEIPKAGSAKSLGTLKIRVFDDTGRPLHGAYVRYRGLKKGKRATDAKGTMRVNLPEGRYIIDLPPCGTTVMPQSPGEVDVVIVAGQTALGDITAIPWKRRFYPTPSVKLHSDAPWSRSESVTLGVRVEDGCRFTHAPGASLAHYDWKLSSNFRLVRAPRRADGDGYGEVVVRCVSRGDGAIVIYDPLKPDVKVDLLASVSDQPGPWCE